VKRAILRVILFSGLAQGVGFFKSILIAFYFGVSPRLDGYYLSQVLPAFGVGIVTALIQAGLIPLDARLSAEGREIERFRVRGAIFWLVFFVGGFLAVMTALTAPWLVWLLSHEASPEVQAAAVESLRVLACLLFINSLADYLGLVLNADMRFSIPALAPAANAAVGLTILQLWPEYGLTNLIWGTLAGVVAQLVIVSGALGTERICYRLARSEMPLASLYQVASQALAIFPGVLTANLSAALPQVLAARFGDGAVSTMGYALRIHGAVTQVLVMAVSTVLLPHFSALVAGQQWRELGQKLEIIWFNVLWVGLMLPLGVGLVGLDAVHLVFGRGLFDAEAEMSVYRVWWWLSFALLPMLWAVVLAKLLQGLSKSGLLSWLSLLGLIALLAAGNLLGQVLAVNGVAIAIALSYGVVAVACHAVLMRVGRDCPGLKPALLKQTLWTAAAVAVLAGAGIWISWSMKNAEGITRMLLLAAALGVGGFGSYRGLSAGLELRVTTR